MMMIIMLTATTMMMMKDKISFRVSTEDWPNV